MWFECSIRPDKARLLSSLCLVAVQRTAARCQAWSMCKPAQTCAELLNIILLSYTFKTKSFQASNQKLVDQPLLIMRPQYCSLFSFVLICNHVENGRIKICSQQIFSRLELSPVSRTLVSAVQTLYKSSFKPYLTRWKFSLYK